MIYGKRADWVKNDGSNAKWKALRAGWTVVPSARPMVIGYLGQARWAAGRSREGVQAARLKRGSWHDENPFLV
jgi:hypothetical protein